MTQPFGHEKLEVYRKALNFAAMRGELLANLPRRVAACDHLERGAESILVNISHASSSWSPKKRIVHLGDANGSALECAACLDVFIAKRMLVADVVYAGKCLLAEIVGMLIAMWKTTADRVRENHVTYRTGKGRLFSHEDLDVYQVALDLTARGEEMLRGSSCSANLRSKLDKSTTSIVLNIAEGNGRFSGTDQAKFLGIAYKSITQSASLVDLAAINSSTDPDRIEEARELLRRIAAMLSSLTRTATHDT